MQTADWLQTIIVFRIRQQWDYCCHLLICMAKTTVRSLYHTQAYGKARIRNRSRKRNRNRNRNRKRNPNLRNKTWRRFCLTIIARSRLFIPTLYLFIVIIFFTVLFFAYGAKFFLREFHICVSVATWDHDWHEYSSSLCRLFLTMDETRSPFKKWVT